MASRSEESSREQQPDSSAERACPLCGSQMTLRGRDPLRRALGLVLLYAAALLFLIWLPALGADKAASVLIIAAYGCLLARNRQAWWCGGCWFEAPRGGRDRPWGRHERQR